MSIVFGMLKHREIRQAASSLQVVAELVKNNKDFEQYYLPGFSHNLGAEWVTRRVFEFFYRNCR